jgi:mannose-6-phosphate isomerase-like protein (cupin superfamily)
MTGMQTPSLESWDIRHQDDVEWLPWGSEGNARVKILGEADGYTVAVVQADAGYKTPPHQHAYAEFFYLIDGSIRNQGQQMSTGDGYAAATGSVHTDFEVCSASTYLSIFRL